MNPLRKLYIWTLKKSEHPKAAWFLALISFTESSFFPIPPDIILIPLIILVLIIGILPNIFLDPMRLSIELIINNFNLANAK